MAELKITRLSGESEDVALIPTIVRRHAVELIDPRGDLFRSADGVEFGLTADELEVFNSVPEVDFAEVQHVLHSIGWRKALVTGSPEWVRKVLAYPGSVEFVVDEEDYSVLSLSDAQVETIRLTVEDVLPEMPAVALASDDSVFEGGIDAAQEHGGDLRDAGDAAAALPSPDVFVRVAGRSEPVWASCEMNVKGLVSVGDEPELVEAMTCIGRYLARVGYPAEVLPTVYMSIKDNKLEEFSASFEVK